jgi:hypothetical protein
MDNQDVIATLNDSQSIADRCCGSGAILDVLAEAGLVNKVMPEWRKLRDPANFLNKADDWPEIEIESISPALPFGSSLASSTAFPATCLTARGGFRDAV